METENRSDLRDGEPGGAGSQACEFARFPTKFSGARGSSQVGQLVGARSGAGGRLARSHRLGATLSLEEEPTAKTCPRAGAGPSRESPGCPQTGAGAATGRGRLAGEGSFLASPVPPLKQPQPGNRRPDPDRREDRQENGAGGRVEERDARPRTAGRGELGLLLLARLDALRGCGQAPPRARSSPGEAGGKAGPSQAPRGLQAGDFRGVCSGHGLPGPRLRECPSLPEGCRGHVSLGFSSGRSR